MNAFADLPIEFGKTVTILILILDFTIDLFQKDEPIISEPLLLLV